MNEHVLFHRNFTVRDNKERPCHTLSAGVTEPSVRYLK